MRAFTTITHTLFGIALGSLMGALAAFAQAPQPAPPAMSPEQQIEALQQQTIDLRKQNGQLISQMAFCEEYALKIKKELAQAKDHAAAQGKAAESKAPTK